MHAVTRLEAARELTSLRSSLRALPPPGQPADLYMRALDQSGHVVLVSFSLGRLLVLTRAELEVVRWAHAGHSNGVIARERRTSIFTVARQMSEGMRKLGIGARVRLAMIPELSAWSAPGLGIRVGDVPARTLLSGSDREVDPHEVARIWREIAADQWITLTGVDAGGLRHAVMRRDSAKPVPWRVLNHVQRNVLDLTASGFPQKVISMKLDLAPSTMSGALQRAHKLLGFSSLCQLLRAYCASKEIIDFDENEASVVKQMTIDRLCSSRVDAKALPEEGGP
jgi:DNA-binding CsgD family transcriptional regulator